MAVENAVQGRSGVPADLASTPPRTPRTVVLVVSNLEYGGTQRQVVELTNGLDTTRFDVHVCSLSEHVPLAAGLRRRERCLHVIPKRWSFDLTVVLRLAQLLKRLHAEVVHGFLFDADLAARLAGRLAHCTAVFGSERNADYCIKRRQLLAYRMTRRFVDMVIANSRAGAVFHARMVGHDASQYRVIHNGVDVSRFAPCDAQVVRRELGIRPGEDVVGMFASFKRQKNHPLFFAAARRVLAARPATRFLLVGDELHRGLHGSDEYKREMSLLVDRLELREHCIFAGNREDVTPLYCACDVTVLPSLHEGTPNVLLESMACGVPVITTNVSDNAFLVPDGKVGYVVPLGGESVLADRICELLMDDSHRRTLGRAAREWAGREFSTTVAARQTEDAYEQALARKVGPLPVQP